MGSVGQIDADAYARAAKLIGANLERSVRNAAVVPRWIGGEDRFWYLRGLPEDGHAFVHVDATTGARRPAFDHEVVARALVEAGETDATPTRLPFRDFSFGADGTTIAVRVGDRRYVIDPTGDAHAEDVDLAREAMVIGPAEDMGLTVRDGDLWITGLADGRTRRLTRDGSPDAGYAIHPDAHGSNAIPRRRSGHPDPPLGTSWSPDGRWIIVPYFDQRGVDPYPFIDSVPTDGDLRPRLHQVRLPLVGQRPASVEWFGIDLTTDEVRHLDLPTSSMLALQADLLPVVGWWWNANAPRAYAAASGDTMGSASLLEVDLESGGVRVVIEEATEHRTDLNPTSYNPPNVWVDPEGRDAIWFSQRDGWGHLYRYDIETGEPRGRITNGEWVVRDLIKVDRGIVYVSGCGREAGNPYHRYLYRAPIDGSSLDLLSPEPADHLLQPSRRLLYSPDGVDIHDPVAPSGRSVVYTYSTVEQPPCSVLRSTVTGEVIIELERADASRLYAAGWRPPQEFVVKADDGVTDLWGVMYTPPGLDPSGSYPILDAQYAAPLIATTPRNFHQAYEQGPGLSQAAYAELGFVVVTVDGRGTPFRSKTFMDATWGHLNTNGLEDHVAAIRQLADRHAFIDAQRAGIYGISYGGFFTIRAMLEFPDVFRAGIAGAPIAIMPGMYADYHWSAFQGRPTYPDGGEERTAPDEIPTNWTFLDARTQVAKLAGHLFLQIGELDENVLPGQLMRFIDALIRENKDFEMLLLPGRDHYLMREGYIWRRNWDFMIRHLLGLEPPEDPAAIEVAAP